MNQAEVEAYNRKEIREVIKAFKAMDETAIDEAKKVSGALADYALGKIKVAAGTRTVATKVATRIANNGKVSKTSKVGEISLGLLLKDSLAVEQLKAYGVEWNSDLIDSHNSQIEHQH
jgi:hypothetical protein